MLQLVNFLQSFQKDEKGQALTEYGLIIALIAVVLIGALVALSGGLSGIFNGIAGKLVPPT